MAKSGRCPSSSKTIALRIEWQLHCCTTPQRPLPGMYFSHRINVKQKHISERLDQGSERFEKGERRFDHIEDEMEDLEELIQSTQKKS